MEPIVKRVWFKPYQYLVTNQNTTYHVRVLPVTQRTLLTINSKYIWNLKTGKAQGVRYNTHGSHLVNLKEFLQLPNPIVVFKQRPFKILQYLNESDIIDISSASSVHDVPMFTNLQHFLSSLSKSEQ